MGFKRGTYLLTFDDPRLEGLEIRARGASVAEVATVMGLAYLAGKDVTKEDMAELDILFRLFAGCPQLCTWAHEDRAGQHYVSKIISWNLEDDDDTPVAPSYEQLVSEEMAFQVSTVMNWLDAVLGTPGELGKDSSSGGPLAEESIPMETLSLAQVS
jgi:hypothetical protein